jgi:hypothetical protein
MTVFLFCSFRLCQALCHSFSAPLSDPGVLSNFESAHAFAMRRLAHACGGVLFLGAAHKESSGESFGQMAAKAAAAVQPSLEQGILRELEESSVVFDRINDSFLKYMNKRGGTFRAITFYEVVPITGQVITVVH